MDSLERNQIVIDTIKEWFQEKDANFLAVEGLVVYWESVTGLPEDCEWQKVSAIEAARILKATRINYQLMQYCTGDAIITAAQEMDRVFVRGVRSVIPVKSEFFNYYEYEKSYKSLRYRVAEKCVLYWRDKKLNPKWTMVSSMVEEAWERVLLPSVSPVERNKILGEVCKDVGYIVQRKYTRYNCPIHGKTAVMKLPNVKYATVEIDPEEREYVILNAIGGHQCKKESDGSTVKS